LSGVRSTSETPAGQGAENTLAPLTLCVGAGFVLAFTPVLVWRVKTGDWLCLNEFFSLFYLRFAARIYYDRLLYMSDIAVPGGVTLYPWLQFVPPTYVARALATGPLAVNLIWISLTAVGLGAGLYLVFQSILKRPWVAAGCTVFCLSEYGLAAARPLTSQLQMLASALWLQPKALVYIPWGLLLQWRVPNPGLDLPFMCFQIVALARAREKPTRLNLWLSGLALGVLFYVFFYCWTLALAGLSIAFMLDRAKRKIYGITLCVGSIIGLPSLIYSIHLDHLASAEAMRRFGLLAPAPRLYDMTKPTLSVLFVAVSALWIWKSKRRDLVYLWSLVVAGILLSRSRAVTGIFFHEYHYDWLWLPMRLVLLLIIVVSIFTARLRWRPVAAWVSWAALILYFAGGVYLAAICVTRTWSGVHQLRIYTRYKSQRLAASVKPLVPGGTVAGDDDFCELAAVAEDQWVLSGEAVARSMAVDNDQWELRTALNAYLEGTDRPEFEKAAQLAAGWFWESSELQSEAKTALMRKYDEVVHDPGRFIAEFGVRYVALAADRAEVPNLRAGWTILQRGPYWQIWERVKSQP
jgi:hypothetical protein